MSNATYRVTDYEEFAQRTMILCQGCQVYFSMDLCLGTEHLGGSIERCETCGALAKEDVSDEDEQSEDDESEENSQ